MASSKDKHIRDSRNKADGFGEAPQAGFSGAPLSGTIADWAKEIGDEAAKPRAKNPKQPKKIPERSKEASRTGRGTSMGGAASAKERTAAGLNPVAGLDISLEEAAGLSPSGATATVQALADLIQSGNPLFKHGELWTPHRPARPEKSEGGIPIRMETSFEPSGDQPTAIRDLVEGLENQDRTQVLLGVTGSGKTFTMAQVIEKTQRPALILAPNKTLAAQLYGEFKSFFPNNAVEYFVSYYDYYQPEAYVPRSDTYIEKESSINEQIDRMRHSATRALLERDDVIIVASVSCIYGIGSVETYTAMTFEMKIGDRLDQRQLLADLVAQQYKRQDINFVRGSFRVRGDTIEIFPAHLEDRAWRISLFGDEIETITEFDPLTGQKTGDLKSVKIYANSHYVTPRPTLNQAIKSIKEELKHRLDELTRAGRLLEAQRLDQRTTFDLEMLEATGSCAGIENYSRYLTGRKPGEPPPTLFEYIPDNALVSSMKATSRFRRSAACIAATSAARRRLPNMVSACPPAWTTARSASRNGTPCARRPSPFRQRPETGRWRKRAASSQNRSSARPASSTRRSKSVLPRRRWTMFWAKSAIRRRRAIARSSPC